MKNRTCFKGGGEGMARWPARVIQILIVDSLSAMDRASSLEDLVYDYFSFKGP